MHSGMRPALPKTTQRSVCHMKSMHMATCAIQTAGQAAADCIPLCLLTCSNGCPGAVDHNSNALTA